MRFKSISNAWTSHGIICKRTVHFCAVYFIATFLCAHLRKNSIFHTPSISSKKREKLNCSCYVDIVFSIRILKSESRLEPFTWTTSLWLNHCTLCFSLSTVDKCSDHALSGTFFALISKCTQMHCQTHSSGLSLRTALSSVILFGPSKRPFWNGSVLVFNNGFQLKHLFGLFYFSLMIDSTFLCAIFSYSIVS